METGRWKEMKIKWRDEKLEKVKYFLYLGYVMSRNKGNIAHIQYQTRKANAIFQRYGD